MTPNAIDGRPLYLATLLSSSGPNSTIAMSLILTKPPSLLVSRIIFSNSFGSVRLVIAITDSSLPLVSILPAGTSKFCSCTALSTSFTVRP